MSIIAAIKKERRKLKVTATEHEIVVQPDVVVGSSMESISEGSPSINIDFRFIQDYKLGSLKSLYYIPSLISIEHEQKLLQCIEREGETGNKWIKLKTRILQEHQNLNPDVPEIFTSWLQDLINEITKALSFGEDFINHVLINRYETGEGIMHHTDGPSYESKVAILSLESPCILSFRKILCSDAIGQIENREVISIILEPRSLLVFEDDLYTNHMHGIETVAMEAANRDTCVNLKIGPPEVLKTIIV